MERQSIWMAGSCSCDITGRGMAHSSNNSDYSWIDFPSIGTVSLYNMTKNFMSSILDELMGRNRNALPTEKPKQLHWDDPEICTHYLVCFCPHELFVNTKADLGACPKLHDEQIRKKYLEDAPTFKKAMFEADFIRFAEKMISDIEAKIKRGKMRIALANGPDGGTYAGPGSKNAEKIALLTDKINSILEEAEEAGCEGDVEKAQGLMKLCDQLKDEREQLKSHELNHPWNPDKAMQVCEVCGSYLIIGEAQHRLDDHIMGKQHVGFAMLRKNLEDIKKAREKRNEEERARVEKERERRWGGTSSTMNNDRHRSRDWDRKRNSDDSRRRDDRHSEKQGSSRRVSRSRSHSPRDKHRSDRHNSKEADSEKESKHSRRNSSSKDNKKSRRSRLRSRSRSRSKNRDHSRKRPSSDQDKARSDFVTTGLHFRHFTSYMLSRRTIKNHVLKRTRITDVTHPIPSRSEQHLYQTVSKAILIFKISNSTNNKMSADNKVGDAGSNLAAAGDETTAIKLISSFKEVETLSWQQIKSVTNFAERVGHALVACSMTTKIYMLGGGNHNGDISEIWVLDYGNSDKTIPDGLSWEPLTTNGFSGRYEFAAALNPSQDKIWIFGGADFQTPRNDICYLDLKSEEFVTKFPVNREMALKTRDEDDTKDFGVPFPRTQGGNSCLLEVGERTYMAVYGGGVKGELAVPDGHLYLYDVESGEWERIFVTGDTPGLRQGHVMTSVGTKIFVHGGMHEFAIFDDLYSIDLKDFREKTPTWLKIHTEVHPGGRAAQGIVKDGGDIYIFGGLGDDGTLGDLWKFNTESLQWSEVVVASEFVSPRLDAAMTLVDLGEGSDESGKSKKILLVHGGMNTEGTLYKDFWALALP
ncbi:unnamed protein product [Allacma fusca]|uniref:Luc7-like protein 3 n=1 Tax=Allacma fusca TaxID=39272 RepID=A0A8J2NRR4_9HEXA|nr:unnamed protein product [Allacma fusca]